MAKKTTLSYSDAIAELETIVNKLQNNEYEIDELQMHDTFARIIEILQIQIIRDRRSSPKNIGRVERLNRIYKWLLTPTI